MALFTSSKSLLVIIIVFIPIACLIGRLLSLEASRKRIKKNSYYAVPILTKNEYSFYMKLRSRINDDLLIFPKVRMEDLVNVNKGFDNSNRTRYRNYIKSRHLDFAIADKDLHILCAIELDDSSHFSKEAKVTDKLKNDILKDAQIPLLRGFNNQNDVNTISYSINKIYLEKGL